MTDTHITMQAQHVSRVEGITHQAVTLAEVQMAAVTGHNACRILAAVLQYRQAVIDLLVDWPVGHDADDAAHNLLPDAWIYT
jgi:hypothetical protein